MIHCSSFILGQGGSGSGGEPGKSPWVYVTIDGTLQSCKLYVYNVSIATNSLVCVNVIVYVGWECNNVLLCQT